MSMEHILEAVRSFDGVLELAPVEGSGFPSVLGIPWALEELRPALEKAASAR